MLIFMPLYLFHIISQAFVTICNSYLQSMAANAGCRLERAELCSSAHWGSHLIETPGNKVT